MKTLGSRLLAWLLALPFVLALQVGAVSAQDSYLVKAGDVLRVEVLEDGNLNRSVLVAPDGRISLPLAGAIRVAGLSVDQIQVAIADRLAPNFATAPTVFVGLDRLAEPKPVASGGGGPAAAPPTVNVFVMGEANKPGKFAVEPGTTILQFMAEIGGFTKFAATKRIQLRRMDADGNEKLYKLNFRAVEQGATGILLEPVADGDVFIIPQRRLFE